jgi:hypothetical protein
MADFYTVDIKELEKESPDASMVPDVIYVPHGTQYGMESWGDCSAENVSEWKLHRVWYEGGWYAFNGTEDGLDILSKIPAAILKAEQEAKEAEKAKEIADKGHDCWDFVTHDYDGNDYYFCSKCDEILQVG